MKCEGFFKPFGHEMDAFKIIEVVSKDIFWLENVFFLLVSAQRQKYEDVCARVSVSQTDKQTDRWFD